MLPSDVVEGGLCTLLQPDHFHVLVCVLYLTRHIVRGQEGQIRQTSFEGKWLELVGLVHFSRYHIGELKGAEPSCRGIYAVKITGMFV